MLDKIILDKIIYFLQLYELQSFKKCAESFNIQPSTLSKYIIELEIKLGNQLIIRTSKRFEVTNFGEYIYNQFRHLPLFTERVLNAYAQTQDIGNSVGTLNITLGIFIAYELVCPRINTFLQNYPEIKLNINFASYLNDWPDYDPDIVLSNHRFDNESIVSRFARTEYGRLYCTSSYVSKYGLPLTIEDLDKHAVIGYLDGEEYPKQYTKLRNINTNEEYLVDFTKSQINVNSAIHLKQIGIHSDFIFGSFPSLVKKELDSGLLIPVLPHLIISEPFEFYLYSKRKISRVAQLFIDFIYECMRS